MTGFGHQRVTGLLLALVLASAGIAGAATAVPSTEEVHVRTTSHALHLNWQAGAGGLDGEFLLLSGPDADSLRPIARLRVDEGRRYRLFDEVEFSGRMVYELRFVDSHGHESVLATRNVSVEVIEGHPSGEIAPGFSLPLGLAASAELPQPSIASTSVPEARWDTTAQAESPPSPPPRRG